MKRLIMLPVLLAANLLMAQGATFFFPTNPSPSVILAWDSVAGMTYNLYWGVGSQQYTNKTSLGATNQITVTLPTRGTTFFFAVTAKNAQGLESAFSSEVTYSAAVPPGAPANMRPPAVLTAQISSKPNGPWNDTDIQFATSQVDPVYFRLVASVASQPMPILLKLNLVPSTLAPALPGKLTVR